MWIQRVPALATAALIGVALLAGAVPAAAAGTPPNVTLDPGMRAHPMLQYGAQAESDKKVRVVVQLTAVPEDAREFAQSVKANFVEAFPFINAIVLDINFRDIPNLA